MPYKNPEEDAEWHRQYYRANREGILEYISKREKWLRKTYPWFSQRKYQRELELHPDLNQKFWIRKIELHGREYINRCGREMYHNRKIKKLNIKEGIKG